MTIPNVTGIIQFSRYNSDRNIVLGQPRKFSKNENFKSNGNIIQITKCIPGETLKTLYKSLISSYLKYGLLLWEVKSHKVEIMQKTAIRLVTNSSYFAHTTPLFIKLNLLKIQDMFKLKLLKFFYKLSYDLLPPYFNTYRNIIMQEPARTLRQNLRHPPYVKRVYTECKYSLIQQIALVNTFKADKNDTNLVIIESKSHSRSRFSFSVSRLFLNSYNPVCNIIDCFVCNSD